MALTGDMNQELIIVDQFIVLRYCNVPRERSTAL